MNTISKLLVTLAAYPRYLFIDQNLLISLSIRLMQYTWLAFDLWPKKQYSRPVHRYGPGHALVNDCLGDTTTYSSQSSLDYESWDSPDDCLSLSCCRTGDPSVMTGTVYKVHFGSTSTALIWEWTLIAESLRLPVQTMNRLWAQLMMLQGLRTLKRILQHVSIAFLNVNQWSEFEAFICLLPAVVYSGFLLHHGKSALIFFYHNDSTLDYFLIFLRGRYSNWDTEWQSWKAALASRPQCYDTRTGRKSTSLGNMIWHYPNNGLCVRTLHWCTSNVMARKRLVSRFWWTTSISSNQRKRVSRIPNTTSLLLPTSMGKGNHSSSCLRKLCPVISNLRNIL